MAEYFCWLQAKWGAFYSSIGTIGTIGTNGITLIPLVSIGDMKNIHCI